MSEPDDAAPRDEATPSPASDPDREAILRRRQRFIAAALTGIAAASTGCPSKPQPCLKVATTPNPQATAAPRACLEALPPPPRDEEPQGRPEPPAPQPCLSVPAPDERPAPPEESDAKADPELAPPQPCLRVQKQD